MKEKIEMLTSRQAAALGIIGESGLRKLIRQGKIKTLQIGNRFYLCEKWLLAGLGLDDNNEGKTK